MVEVYILKGKDPVKLAYDILAKMKPEITGKVLIKPNVTMNMPPSSGVITDPKFCEGIINYIENDTDEIAIGEGSGSTPDTSIYFASCGYKDLAEEKGIKLIDFHKDESIKLKIPNGKTLKEVYVAKSLKEYDYIINVPVLKTHPMATTTLSMKNLMGFVLPWDKKGQTMHKTFNLDSLLTNPRTLSQKEYDEAAEDFSNRLCDLCSVIKPNLNVIDGVIAREGDGFKVGSPVNANVAIAGYEPVAVDSVGSYMIGYDPSKIRYLIKAAERNLGTNDLSKIKIVGEPLEVIKKFDLVTVMEKWSLFSK